MCKEQSNLTKETEELKKAQHCQQETVQKENKKHLLSSSEKNINENNIGQYFQRDLN